MWWMGVPKARRSPRQTGPQGEQRFEHRHRERTPHHSPTDEGGRSMAELCSRKRGKNSSAMSLSHHPGVTNLTWTPEAPEHSKVYSATSPSPPNQSQPHDNETAVCVQDGGAWWECWLARIAGRWQIVSLQESVEFLQHEDITRAVLYDPLLGCAQPCSTSTPSSRTFVVKATCWARKAVISKDRFRRTPHLAKTILPPPPRPSPKIRSIALTILLAVVISMVPSGDGSQDTRGDVRERQARSATRPLSLVGARGCPRCGQMFAAS